MKLGATELIVDNLNPVLVHTIETDFFFEEQHQFLVEVYDCDDATALEDLSKQELIGSHQFSLHDVVTQMNQELSASLTNPAR